MINIMLRLYETVCLTTVWRIGCQLHKQKWLNLRSLWRDVEKPKLDSSAISKSATEQTLHSPPLPWKLDCFCWTSFFSAYCQCRHNWSDPVSVPFAFFVDSARSKNRAISSLKQAPTPCGLASPPWSGNKIHKRRHSKQTALAQRWC